jgi:hypothetical protein
MTTNSELLTMADKLGLEKFRGVFMADELKSLRQEANECGIVNFMLSSQKGSHWVAWYEEGDEKYYFDSYGADILPQLKDYLGSPIQCHSFQIQDFDSDICGELCLLFIYLMSKDMSYEDVILSMVDAD